MTLVTEKGYKINWSRTPLSSTRLFQGDSTENVIMAIVEGGVVLSNTERTAKLVAQKLEDV